VLNVKAGQVVFVKRIGNAARHRLERDLVEPAVVESVGRKWFTIEKYYKERFSLETGLNDAKGYSSNYLVYVSEQTIFDEQEILTKCQYITRVFEYSRADLPLEKVREVYNIVYALKT